MARPQGYLIDSVSHHQQRLAVCPLVKTSLLHGGEFGSSFLDNPPSEEASDVAFLQFYSYISQELPTYIGER